MNKRFFTVLMVLVLLAGLSNASFAMMCGVESQEGVSKQSAGSSAVSQAVNAGNTVCPVSGEKINEASKATYEHQGKVYNFCCAGCIAPFKKDPQSYIKKIEG